MYYVLDPTNSDGWAQLDQEEHLKKHAQII